MKYRLYFSHILMAVLPACSNVETHSGPFVNKPALKSAADTLHRADAYERAGDSPGDAWDKARMDRMFSPSGMPGGMTPVAGYGWGVSTGSGW